MISFMECPPYRTNEVPIYDILYGVYCIMIFTLMIKNVKLLYFYLFFFRFLLDLMTPYHLHSLLNNHTIMYNELKGQGRLWLCFISRYLPFTYKNSQDSASVKKAGLWATTGFNVFFTFSYNLA